MALVGDSAKPDDGVTIAAAGGFLGKLTPLAGIVGFLLVWQIFVVAWRVPAYLLPSPSAIGHAFIDQLPLLLSNGWITVYEMLAGYAMAVGVAIPLAIAITSSQRFNQLVMPTMLFFQIIPKVAIAPLF
ncbi:MAG: ABC transporter permease, partial [Terriglobia bacterium]